MSGPTSDTDALVAGPEEPTAPDWFLRPRRWADMELLAVAARLAVVIGSWQPPQSY